MRVWRHLKGRKFRTHYAVTGLAAKAHRLGVMIGLVTPEGAHRDEEESENEQESRDVTLARIVKIDLWIRAEI